MYTLVCMLCGHIWLIVGTFSSGELVFETRLHFMGLLYIKVGLGIDVDVTQYISVLAAIVL